MADEAGRHGDWAVAPVGRTRGTRLPNESDGPAWLTVTTPLLPSFDDFAPMAREIFESRWVTNQGRHARELEAQLAAYLHADDLALITNATVALEMAFLESIEDGEVIKPAFSFPATWNQFFENHRLKTVIVDIGADFCLDPDAVEAAITPRTTAIIGVHTYGFPCDHDRLRAICDRHGLRLIYDAAHAFGVQWAGQPCAQRGDLNIYSFHATKVYNTLEGGAITGDAALVGRLKRRRNFGLSREEQFSFGTNGKMDELRAAVGLLNLRTVMAIRPGARARFYLDAIPGGTDLLQLFPELLFRGCDAQPCVFPRAGASRCTVDPRWLVGCAEDRRDPRAAVFLPHPHDVFAVPCARARRCLARHPSVQPRHHLSPHPPPDESRRLCACGR